MIDAILCIASTGCQWRQLPKDFPPYSTVQGYFYAWSRGGIFASLNYTLVMAARESAGREDDQAILIGLLTRSFDDKFHPPPLCREPVTTSAPLGCTLGPNSSSSSDLIRDLHANCEYPSVHDLRRV